ncbi:hypothetical protein HRbin11_01291 [bacterium HR11]|nr:hypothetical protein HRbin11_01291 [bacterium HR11]
MWMYFGGLILTLGLWAPASDAPVRARAVADATVVVPGHDFRLGVLLEIDPGWHVYWKNSGDAGLPTQVRFEYGPELEAGDWAWPGPRQFQDPGGITTYGYADRVLLWQAVRVRPSVPVGRRLTVRGEARWLACREICVPGRQTLHLTLTVGRATEVSAHAETFRRFEALVPLRPTALPGWTFRVEAPAPDVRVLEVRPPAGEAVTGLEWFPEDPRTRVTDQTVVLDGSPRLRVGLKRIGAGPIGGSGVLRVRTPQRVFYVQFP